MSHLGLGRGFHCLVDIAAYKFGQGVFEIYRSKPFGLAEAKL